MNEFIRLPQLKFSSPPLDEQVLFVIGGRAPEPAWLIDCARTVDRIWSIDHGIDACRRAELIPELLIGDLDSARSSSIDWARSLNVPLERHPVDKDFTDTQLALERIAQSVARPFVIIAGAFGGRLDHLYANLFTAAHSSVCNCLADQHEIVLFVRDGDRITIELNAQPLALSLLPMTDQCRGISIDGVHWALDHATLRQLIPNAVSNRVESERVNVSIEYGVLAICLTFDRQRQERAHF
ncbi:MAG: thiamine diphosphokinase [Selenomonadaceae bacterium]|nr:thiamine diphosphokinase [Selenomonadaceae bacterium]